MAVKTLKVGSTNDVKIDFLSEAEMMKRFEHRVTFKKSKLKIKVVFIVLILTTKTITFLAGFKLTHSLSFLKFIKHENIIFMIRV